MENILIELWAFMDLSFSALLGFFIGLERKKRFKEAGIRTHTIVCIGSALMTVISRHAFDGEGDSSRLAAQIVSGVGFLGAGMIVYRKHEIHGLTTAAGVWVTSGVGMACGAEMYILAAGSTLILIGVQYLLHINCKAFRSHRHYRLHIRFLQNEIESEKVKELFGVNHFIRLNIERQGEDMMYNAFLDTDKEFPSAKLSRIMKENGFIVSIERFDNE